MNIYISIDGVLRNTIQKFHYHYNDYYLNSDIDDSEVLELDDDGNVIENNKENVSKFTYDIITPIKNDNLMDYFSFQSTDEYNHFLYIEFPIEIYGHAGLSYNTAVSDLNKLMFENPDLHFTIVGLDEFGKAKPSTLFFLSKNGFLGDNIKFITSDKINQEWKNCDVWITDNKKIIDACPNNKAAVMFETDYNSYFTNNIKIDKLNKIENLWLKSLGNFTT